MGSKVLTNRWDMLHLRELPPDKGLQLWNQSLHTSSLIPWFVVKLAEWCTGRESSYGTHPIHSVWGPPHFIKSIGNLNIIVNYCQIGGQRADCDLTLCLLY